MLCNWTFWGEAVITIACGVRDDISQVLSIHLLENKTGSYAHRSTKGHQTKHFGLRAGVILPQPKSTVDVIGVKYEWGTTLHVCWWCIVRLRNWANSEGKRRFSSSSSSSSSSLLVCLFSFLFCWFVCLFVCFFAIERMVLFLLHGEGGGGTCFVYFVHDVLPGSILHFDFFRICSLCVGVLLLSCSCF